MKLQLVVSSALAVALFGCPTPPSPPDPAQSDVTVDRPTGAVADGQDRVTITVTVKNAQGQPVSGQTVTLAVSGRDNTLSPVGPTDASGVATATLSTTAAETKTITASIAEGTIPRQPQVTFGAGAVSQMGSTITVTPATVAADGLAAAVITITARDAFNNLVAGAPVVLSASGSQNTLVQPPSTSAQGQASGTLSSTRAEAKVITATVAGTALLQRPVVQFTPTAATRLAFRVQPSAVQAGARISPAVEVAVEDAQGNLITDATATVTLALGGGTAGAILGGTLTRTVQGGLASFGDLTVDKSGTGYLLSASATGLSAATSQAFNVTAGAAAKLAFTAQPQDAVAGGTLSPPIQIELQDQNGNRLAGATSAVTLSLGGGPAGATLSGTTTVSAVNGVATFADLSIARAGSGYVLNAVAGGFTGATSGQFSVAAGPASRLAFLVSPSSPSAGAAFSPPVQVAVQDALGNTVASDTRAVTVALGANPAGGTLSGTTTVSAVGGVATFPTLSIDRAGTGYTLAATASSLAPGISNTFDVRPGPAAQLVFSAQPATTTAGAALPEVRVTAMDAFGNVATGFSQTVTVALGTNPAGGTLSGTTSVPASGGVASFLNLSINRAGQGYTLSASASGVAAAASSPFDITPGAAARLAFSVQPTTTTSSQPIAPPVKVQVQDALGNLVPSATSTVTIALASGPGGTLSGTRTVSASSGEATFGDLSIDRAGGGYSLSATASGLIAATSATFSITVGPAARLVFSVQPQNVTAGSAISPAVQVEIQDSGGNRVTTSTAPITMALGANPGGGTLAGTTTVNAAGGVATFSNLSINRSGAGYSLAASSGALAGAVSSLFDVAAGPPASVGFFVQPSSVVAGSTISPAVQAVIQDAFGNAVTTATNVVTVSLAANPGAGTLSGTLARAASGGFAVFTDLSINRAAAGYALGASSPGLTSGTSAPFNVTAGAPTRLAFAVQPTNVQAGAFITPAVVVEIQDALGNRVTTASNPVGVAFSSNPTGGTLMGTITRAASAGLATFDDLFVDRAGGPYSLAASSAGLTGATSSTFQVTVGPAFRLAFGTQPSSATAGSPILPSPTVAVQDQMGNTVTTSSASITVAFASNPGGGTISGTTTRNAVSGVATFSGLSIDRAANGYALGAASTGLNSATSQNFNITPGAPSRLAFTGQPSSAVAGAIISPPVQVTVQDAFGNTVPTATNVVTMGLQSNPGGDMLSGTQIVSAVNGVATFGDLSLRRAASGYALLATSPGLSSGASTPFNVTAGAPAQLGFTVQPSNVGVNAPITPAVQVAVQDSFGNTVTSDNRPVTVALLSNPGGAVLAGTTTVNAMAGVAAYGNLSLNVVASGYTLRATAAPLAAADSAAFAVTEAGIACGRIGHYVTDVGVVSRPDNLTSATIGAYVLDGGTYSYYPGAGQMDGGCSIPGVPGGPYVFRYGNSYIQTSTRTMDLSYSRQGRPDVQNAQPDSGTYLRVSLNNLEPFGDWDDVQMYSTNAGVWNSFIQFDDVDFNYPNPGDTSLAQRYDYAAWSTLDTRMVNADAGDRLNIIQLATRYPPEYADAGFPYHYVSASRIINGAVTVLPATEAILAGPMALIPQNQSAFLNYHLAEATPGSFGSYRAQVNPGATQIADYFYVSASPDISRGFYDAVADVAVFDHVTLAAHENVAFNMTYGNPYPASFARVGLALVQFRVRRAMPNPDGGTSSQASIFGLIRADEPLATMQLNPLRPAISPVQNPTLNGVSLFNDQSSVGDQPTIAWTPPSLGVPTHYQVAFREMTLNGSITVRGPVFARIHTTATSVKVPPGILQPGRTYVIIIGARRMVGSDIQSRPFTLSFPDAVAETISGLIRP
jgi:hypothetical protein